MRIYAIIFLSLWINRIQAIEPHFISREINEAYAHLTINLIFQERQCMIWLGTSEGLIQYTGTQFIPIPFPDTSAKLSVTSLYEDHNGILWVGTETGQIFTYTVTHGLAAWGIDEGMPGKQITGFLEDSKGQFWISTYGEGLYVYSNHKLTNIDSDDGLPDTDIYALAIDGKDRVWAGTDKGIAICSFDGEKHIRLLTTKDGLPDQIISAMTADDKGNLWIATREAGLAYYDISTERITEVISIPDMNQINCIALYADLELWIGTEKSGLWRYIPSTQHISKITKTEDLQNAEVRDLLRDVEGNLWVVSGTNSLHSAYRPFETLDIAIGNIQSLYTSTQEQLWLGTDQGLFRAWQSDTGQWMHEQIGNAPFSSVASLSEDEFGNLWIGSLDVGLCVYDPLTGKFLTFKSQKELHLNPVISLFIDGKSVWLSTIGQGIVHLRMDGNIMKSGTFHLELLKDGNGSSHSFVFQLLPKNENETWLATDGGGLAFTDHGVIRNSAGNDSIRQNTVYSIAYDPSGHIWLNTPKDGLIEYNYQQNSSLPLTINHGLRSLTISGLISNSKGELIIVHQKGIDILLPKERHFMYFDDEIGLQRSTPVLNAVFRDASGNIWIGMRDKVVKYSALKEDLSIHPRTRIEHVLVNQEAIDFHQKSLFHAGENFFAFDYAGLWYTSPAAVKYQYTLEGHDLGWKESADHLAIYSNLKPGKYVFRVKASENKFFYDEPLAEYAFEIEKPFWREPWFIALSSLTVVLLAYFIVKNREARLRRIEVLNKEKIESQFHALKAQINPHFLFNSFNTLITIIDENTADPNIPIEYVQKLADFYRSMLQYREEEAISIPEEITLVKNYYYLLQKRYGHNLILDIRLNDIQGYIPPLTLQMLVENAVKHNVISKSHPLRIRIVNEGEYMLVENNVQHKLADAPSTKFGLQSIMNRYEVIFKKKVVVEENGNTFKVFIPIIKNIS